MNVDIDPVAGVVRIVVFTPFILAIYAFATAPKAVAVALSEGSVSSVVGLLTALPNWPVVVLVTAAVVFVAPEPVRR